MIILNDRSFIDHLWIMGSIDHLRDHIDHPNHMSYQRSYSF